MFGRVDEFVVSVVTAASHTLASAVGFPAVVFSFLLVAFYPAAEDLVFVFSDFLVPAHSHHHSACSVHKVVYLSS